MLHKKFSKSLSGTQGKGLLYTMNSDTFASIFLFSSIVVALNFAFSDLIKSKDGIIDTIMKYLKKIFLLDINDRYIHTLIHLFMMFIHNFILMVIFFQLFGYGKGDLGPCQTSVKCK